MKRHTRQGWSKVITLLFTVLLSSASWSTSLTDLQSAQRLEIGVELIPATNIVPGQHVELVINIATDRWFSGGTRLEIPEVPGLVILQTNEFANNASENRAGHSWVIQRWTLDVFPQREGNFTIPPIKARLTINDETDGNVAGELQSPSVQFQASTPDALAQTPHWVAAPGYKVSQRFDKALHSLKVGDAFEREIVFEATEVMAMMLPTFTAEEIPGLAAYPQPSSLKNSSNRGSMEARRVEHITYVVEQQANYQLPARDYYWWDTRSGELQIRFLPAVEIQVGAGAGGDSNEQQADLLASIDLRQLLVYAGIGVAILGFCWLLYRRVSRMPLGRFTDPIKRGWQRFNQMRQPALPTTLNPDSSAGE